ncbi:MAG TPA: S26 family signal peptidase [Leifsonia sp.]|nr:S26 family signal peptidase [Leifsonia sp.]
MHARKRTRVPLATIIVVVFTAVLVAAVAGAGVFYAQGGRWVVVQTPSMGEYAPVGTLVISAPVSPAQLHTGETILFHPPTSPNETYFHRIVSVAGPIIRTKGDINGSVDPWILHSSDVIGHEVARFVGVGMLLQALPILLVGGVLLEILTRYYAAAHWRAPIRVLGWSMLVAAAIVIVRPLVQAVILTQATAGSKLTAILVPTGLLTLDTHAVNGTTAVLRPGQPGSVQTSRSASAQVMHVLLSPHFDAGTVTIIGALCLVPTVICLIIVLRKPAGRHA